MRERPTARAEPGSVVTTNVRARALRPTGRHAHGPRMAIRKKVAKRKAKPDVVAAWYDLGDSIMELLHIVQHRLEVLEKGAKPPAVRLARRRSLRKPTSRT